METEVKEVNKNLNNCVFGNIEDLKKKLEKNGITNYEINEFSIKLICKDCELVLEKEHCEGKKIILDPNTDIKVFKDGKEESLYDFFIGKVDAMVSNAYNILEDIRLEQNNQKIFETDLSNTR